jgi:hypothetical protein
MGIAFVKILRSSPQTSHSLMFGRRDPRYAVIVPCGKAPSIRVRDPSGGNPANVLWAYLVTIFNSSTLPALFTIVSTSVANRVSWRDILATHVS